jgi:predicted transcriptional regulator
MARKLENLTIRLEPETREALERQAAREDRPLAYLIRRMLRAEAAQRELVDGRAA